MAEVRSASRGPVENEPARRKRRGSRLGIALLLCSAVFFGINFAQEWLFSHQVQQNVAQLQARIADVNTQNTQLQQQLAYVNSKDYIMTQARADGMVMPNDTLMHVTQLPGATRIVHVPMHVAAPPESFFIRMLRAIFQ